MSWVMQIGYLKKPFLPSIYFPRIRLCFSGDGAADTPRFTIFVLDLVFKCPD